jgi:hypothetical protein
MLLLKNLTIAHRECATYLDEYTLAICAALTRCVEKCWASDVYLRPLVHRFWKLTLQVSDCLAITCFPVTLMASLAADYSCCLESTFGLVNIAPMHPVTVMRRLALHL